MKENIRCEGVKHHGMSLPFSPRVSSGGVWRLHTADGAICSAASTLRVSTSGVASEVLLRLRPSILPFRRFGLSPAPDIDSDPSVCLSRKHCLRGQTQCLNQQHMALVLPFCLFVSMTTTHRNHPSDCSVSVCVCAC